MLEIRESKFQPKSRQHPVRGPPRVTTDKTHNEHNKSAFAVIATKGGRQWDVEARLPSRDSSFQTAASNHVLRTHRPRVGSHQADATKQTARCLTGERPPCVICHRSS